MSSNKYFCVFFHKLYTISYKDKIIFAGRFAKVVTRKNKYIASMGKDKLRKFAEIGTFANVLQLDAGKGMKGQWAAKHFGNDRPIVLELACGKGEYTVNLAKLFPALNFIGVDYKGNRIWRGAKTALEEGIPNVAFLRIQIETI